MCPRHIQRFHRVVDPYGYYIHTVDAAGRTITGHYRCALCSRQVKDVHQRYFQRLGAIAIVGMVLCVVGLITFTCGGPVSYIDPGAMGPGGQQIVDVLLQVGCLGGPALVIGAGLLYRRRYRQYL
jgi:hypothetical protein